MSEIARSNKKYLLWIAEIYIVTMAIILVSAWTNNMHTYELKLTVSKYIGLQRWTAVLYFFMALVMCTMFSIYIIKTKIKYIRKVVYFFILLQIMGCAWFPSASKRNTLSTQTHKTFAFALIFGIVMSFLLMLIWGTNIKQRMFAIIGLLYAGSFIISYFCKIDSFKKTIFIWENVFIVLLHMELYLEDEKSYA